MIRDEKIQKRKAQKEVNVELFIVEEENNTHKHNSGIITLLIESQLRLKVTVWGGLVLPFWCTSRLCCLLSAEMFLQSFQKTFVNRIL